MTITLYGFGPMFGMPDPSSFVIKAHLLLKMAGLPYQVDLSGFSKAPKGKLPYLNDDGMLVADSTFIRRHIETKYGFDYDRGLSAKQKAVAWAFEKMAEDILYWAIVDSRWMDDAQFDKGPRRFFDDAPFIVRPMIVAMVRRQVRKDLHSQGTGRHSPEEKVFLAQRSISALAEQLDRQPYFMGQDPTGVDAAIYGIVAALLCPHFESPLREAAERHRNLQDYAARLTAQYFPEFASAAAAPTKGPA